MEWRTQYAQSGDLSIAYQCAGSGPRNVVVVPPIISHVELFHEFPSYTRYLERLASFAKVAVFDKRGQGLSDHPDHVALLEERIDDIRAVMDACDMAEADVIGFSEGGPASLLFAATYPERVTALVLCGTFALYSGDVDEGAVAIPEFAGPMARSFVDVWGTGAFASVVAPSLLSTPQEPMLSKIERFGVTRRAIKDLWEMVLATDVRPLLPTIRVPTLVMRRSDESMPRWTCQYLADHIPGARYVEVPGIDHAPFVGDVDSYVDVIEEFLTGRLPEIDDEVDRVLATVLFTDIVGSTERAVTEGDRRWRTLLDDHDRMIRAQLDRHRGRLVNTTGDGVLASFDGPARSIRCALAVAAGARQMGLDVRSGVHTGECERRGDDLAGIAVHIGARVAALAAPGEVLVTKTVRDLVVGSELCFDERGTHQLKGVPGEWELLAVQG